MLAEEAAPKKKVKTAPRAHKSEAVDYADGEASACPGRGRGRGAKTAGTAGTGRGSLRAKAAAAPPAGQSTLISMLASSSQATTASTGDGRRVLPLFGVPLAPVRAVAPPRPLAAVNHDPDIVELSSDSDDKPIDVAPQRARAAAPHRPHAAPAAKGARPPARTVMFDSDDDDGSAAQPRLTAPRRK